MARHVREIMSSPVITVTPGTTLEEAAALMLEHRIGSLVVVGTPGSLEPIGILTESDFNLREESATGVGSSWFKLPILLGTAVWEERGFDEAYQRSRRLPVERVMSSPCVTIGEDAEPVEAAQRMIRHDVRHLPVLQNDRLVGLLSGFDFLGLLAASQPESDS